MRLYVPLVILMNDDSNIFPIKHSNVLFTFYLKKYFIKWQNSIKIHVNLPQENKFVWMVNKNSGFVWIFF